MAAAHVNLGLTLSAQWLSWACMHFAGGVHAFLGALEAPGVGRLGGVPLAALRVRVVCCKAYAFRPSGAFRWPMPSCDAEALP